MLNYISIPYFYKNTPKSQGTVLYSSAGSVMGAIYMDLKELRKTNPSKAINFVKKQVRI